MVKIHKSGDSPAIGLPWPFLSSIGLDSNNNVDLVRPDGKTRIRPAQTKCNIKDLVLGITEENRHPETDWGPPAGKEPW